MSLCGPLVNMAHSIIFLKAILMVNSIYMFWNNKQHRCHLDEIFFRETLTYYKKTIPKTLSGSIPSLSPTCYTVKGISKKGPELVNTLMAVCPITSQMLKVLKEEMMQHSWKTTFIILDYFYEIKKGLLKKHLVLAFDLSRLYSCIKYRL